MIKRYSHTNKCPKCKKVLLEDYAICPYCGYDFRLGTLKPTKSKIRMILYVTCGILVLYLVIDAISGEIQRIKWQQMQNDQVSAVASYALENGLYMGVNEDGTVYAYAIEPSK